ncbi:hypothetical protein [Chelativorans sp. J32]|uniref:hypothetical protein n=1 Tax=Chelativorans sp. J32 TaxID=935840 RepID=UPI001AEBF604|nr:hypothetical protein [Chelativorans sp. J32]
MQPAIFYDAAGKARRPSIEVFFDGDDLDVRAVQVQVRLAANGAGVFDGNLPYGDPATNPNPKSVILNGTFLPNTLYEVRGKFVPYGARATDWSLWLPVTTPNVLLGSDDIYPIDIGQLNDDIKNALDWLGGNDRDVWDELERLNQLVGDQGVQNFLDKQELLRDAVATAGNLKATFTEQITVVVTQTEAIAIQVEAVEARIDDPETGLAALAGAMSSLEARVNTDLEAFSQALTQVSSEVGDVSANGLFRAAAFASPGGGWARVGMQARVSTSGGFASPSFFLDAKSDGTSRAVVVADQFVVTSGATDVQPFLFQGGTAYLQNVKVQWADIVNANITWAQMEQAIINNLRVTSAMIDNLAVNTLKIAGDAINVTANFADNGNITIASGGGVTTVGSTSMTVPNDAFNVRILWSHQFVSGSPDAQVFFAIDGVAMYNTDPSHDISAGGIGRQYFQEYIWMTPTAAVHTFEVRMAGGDTTSAINTRRLQVQAQRR